jgi:two-component system chemotaxis response regulator CheB
MAKIRVLIVDDSVVIRRLVSGVLSSDPNIEVAGVAANGRIALNKIAQLSPDIVTLDVEMPEMDGLQTLVEVRKTHPQLPIIMFSTVTERGAVTTLDALSLGASDYVNKPATVGGAPAAMMRVRDDLIPKIKALCGLRDSEARPRGIEIDRNLKAQNRSSVFRSSGAAVKIVAIGTSTGGPNALAELIPQIPADFPVPIVIVQHMPAVFTKLLAERLSAKSPIDVQEGKTGDELRPASAWIAPGDHHMVVASAGTKMLIELNQNPPENSCRPAVDVLFRSVARTYGAAALGVVLTGMGQDGFRGCEHLRQAGAQIIVQDEASSVVWGMPGFVARAGLADQVLPLQQIAGAIVRRVIQGPGKSPGDEREITKHGHIGY